MPPNIESSDGNSGPNSALSNALSPHRDPDGNAGGISFTDELIRYATDHENDDGSPDRGFPGGNTALVLRGGADTGGNTEGGSAPECTCLLLNNVHGVDHECPLAKDGKGGWAHNTNDNTGDKDGETRPTDGSGNTDGNPHDKTTFRADATISRLFNMVPIEDQFIITKANMPKDCGPPSGKPRSPNFTGTTPPRGYSSGMTARGGNMAFLRVTAGKMGKPVSTFVDSTGQNCKGDYVWLYNGFNREQWARDALRQLETETAAESLRRERLMEEYERETLAWEQAAVKKIKESGKADGISTMATRVTSRNERVNHLTAGLIAEGYSRAEIVEALLGIFPGVATTGGKAEGGTTTKAAKVRKGAAAKKGGSLSKDLPEKSPKKRTASTDATSPTGKKTKTTKAKPAKTKKTGGGKAGEGTAPPKRKFHPLTGQIRKPINHKSKTNSGFASLSIASDEEDDDDNNDEDDDGDDDSGDGLDE
ncbi:MAG: hypothetical protein M1823_003904 [Watsoniomyces obsoletus]|nr:MAG: hypothetical protein M1823_003904 [Watsoniomyces obsoletus]